jgi:hypothetical protein
MVTRVLTLLLSLWASTALGGGAGYAQASGYYKAASRPMLYQPLNLLDGRDLTAWCSPSADPLNELLTFGFNGPITLDELRITTGNNFDEGTWKTFARARKLLIRVGKQSQMVELQDARGPQVVPLAAPLKGARFSIEVLDQYPADDPEQPVCLTDVVFVSGGKPLNGPWLTTRLKYDRARATLMGTWFGGYPGTPDRFLSFNFDGTVRWSFEPFDETRATPKVIEGRYELSAGRLQLQWEGRRRGLKLTKDTQPGSARSTLTFDGDVPEELRGVWRSTP